jgi:hypothetical protein
MLARGTPLILLLSLGACSGPASSPESSRENDLAGFSPERVRQYSHTIQQYTDAMLLCGSTNPGDWEEAKRQFDQIGPFLVFKEDPELIRQFKAGQVAARQELARRGVILRSVLIFSTGEFDRAKWAEARKILMDSGEAGQVLLCTTLLKQLMNGQNIQIWDHIRFALIESGPVALETTVGLTKELANATPANAVLFRMDDLVQLIMVIIGFGDGGSAPLEELSRNPKPTIRRSVARAIGESKDGSAVNVVLRLVQDGDWTVRMAAAQALGQLSSARATAGPALLERLGTERDPLVYRAALRALGDLMYVDAVPELIKVLETPSHETSQVAMQALYIITGERFLRRELWIDWYRTRYPDWKKRQLPPR